MGKKKKKNGKKKFTGTVKESVGEGSGGYDWPDYANMKWGMNWY